MTSSEPIPFVVRLVVGACLALAGCSDDSAGPAADAGSDSGPDGGDTELPDSLVDLSFGDFGPWATPIDDYIAVGEELASGYYMKGIAELAPFDGRMWIGYGDGNLNLGEYIDIEFRYFASADEPTAAPAVVDGEGQGAEMPTPYVSGEEALPRYQIIDGKLVLAGPDSIDADELWTQANTDPPAIQGNFFSLDGDVWRKHRSVPGGEHVHDAKGWNGATYAVGSGADYRYEFEAGQIFRYLWRSEDGGTTFETVQRFEYTEGDTRFVHLLPTAEALYLFGYIYEQATEAVSVENASFDGTEVTSLEADHPFARIFGTSVDALPDGSSLLRGVDVDEPILLNEIWRVGPDASAARVEAMIGWTVIDVALVEEFGEILILVAEGDSYADGPTEPYALAAWAAPISDPEAVSELVAFDADALPESIAFWQGSLFLGTGEGEVWKAVAE